MKVSYDGSNPVHKDVYRNLMYTGDNKYSFVGENGFDDEVIKCTGASGSLPVDPELTYVSYDDGSIKSVLLEGSINNDTLVNNGIIPAPVTSKSRLLSASVDNIKSIKFGDPVTNIEESTLVDSNIKSIDFNNSVITDGSLKGCSNLINMECINPDYYVTNGMLFHKGSSIDELLLVDNNVIDLDFTGISGMANVFCYANCYNLRTMNFPENGIVDVIHVVSGMTVTIPNTPTRELTGVRNAVVLINRTGSDIDLNTIPMTGVSETKNSLSTAGGDLIRTKNLTDIGYATYNFYKCIDPKYTDFNAHDWCAAMRQMNNLVEKKVKFINNSWAYFVMNSARPNNDDVVMQF